MTSTSDLQINPAHDPAQYRDALARDGFVQIHDFFTPETAATISRMIAANKTWYVAYNEFDQYFESPLEDYEQVPQAVRDQLIKGIHERAKSSFQYFFNQYYITQAIRYGEDTGHPLHALHHWVNGDVWLDFIRNLTGREDITDSDSFVSQYQPGHFLTRHDDTHDKNKRVAAYTIGMTPDWNPDWGGHLAFFDEKGNVKHGLIPRFNTLSLFLVPVDHSVQMVSPYAGAPRHSLLGWVHAEDS